MSNNQNLKILLTGKSNVLIEHPSGSLSFGRIPDMPSFDLPGGEIFLRVGEHWGANRGFGVKHVWEAHSADLLKYGCATIDAVPQHIAAMIVPGAPIYCEFAAMDGNHRVAVLKNPKGSMILEPRYERRGFGYYVVTWYPKRRAEGTLVGNVAFPDQK